jgi:RNA polymerase sigma-70 factor, ECF subfamily
MVDATHGNLIDLLLANYEALKRRLTKHIGSKELAEDALQETFIRLNKKRDIGPVKWPLAYLFRVAMRLAVKQRGKDDRYVSLSYDELIGDIGDDTPDPVRIVESRIDLEVLKQNLNQLPKRRRDILIAALIYEQTHTDIARRFCVSVRTVQTELKLAIEYCAMQVRYGDEHKRRAGGAEPSLRKSTRARDMTS